MRTLEFHSGPQRDKFLPAW